MDYYGSFQQKKIPASNIYQVSEVKHPLEKAVKEILTNSNNFVAETVFKLAGAKFVKNTGSLANSQKMLNAYFAKLNMKSDNIKIVDGSGVSKNNIMTADFMSEFLAKKEVRNMLEENMPTAGEGTLKNRMLYFKVETTILNKYILGLIFC